MARIAEDRDFETLKVLVDGLQGWSLELETKNNTKVWTRPVEGCNFHMVKIHTEFEDVDSDTMYEVDYNFIRFFMTFSFFSSLVVARLLAVGMTCFMTRIIEEFGIRICWPARRLVF